MSKNNLIILQHQKRPRNLISQITTNLQQDSKIIENNGKIVDKWKFWAQLKITSYLAMKIAIIWSKKLIQLLHSIHNFLASKETERHKCKLWKWKNLTNLGFTRRTKTNYMLEICKKWDKNNNLNDLFPENNKVHKMKTRAMKKYKETFTK